MKLTNEQIKAITVPQSKEERTNVLVSAGAGAGKTFVLIERIAKLLKVCDLDELLVLTFTNQAAASMKEKLRTKLEEDESLRKYLEKIDNAKIMTFDAYSLFLVKKYHLKLGLDPNIQIMDEYYKKTKLREIISEVLEEYYKENNETLKRYFKEDLIRNDETLINDLETLYYTLDKKVDTLDFIKNYKLNFYTKENLNDLKNRYIKLLNSFIDEEKTNLQMLASYLDYKKEVLEEIGRDEGNLDDALIKWMDKVLPCINKTLSYEELKGVFSYQIPARSRKGNNIIQTELVNKAISEIREIIKDSKMQKQEFVSFEDEDDIIESIIYEKDYIFLFLEMIEKIINKYSLYKAKYNVYDFSDIAKLAIKLVKENDDIRDEIKNSLYEILIDEYQDTSDLQEDFINLISDYNVFMVGDIKQSIYLFRNANPFLFTEKLEKYSKGEGGQRVDLTSNFRSRNEVLRDVDRIFKHLMTKDHGDVDYQDNHSLKAGNKNYETLGKLDKDSHMDLIGYYSDKEKKKTDDEIEAFYIAQDILRRKGNDLVYDSKLGSLRPSTFKDYCILIDRSTEFESLKKILEFYSIPTIIYSDTVVEEEDIVYVLNALIRLVLYSSKDNLSKKEAQEYYHLFYVLAKSFLFEYDDNYVAKIMIKVRDENKYYTKPYEYLDGKRSYFDPIFEKSYNLAKLVNEASFTYIYDEILKEFNLYKHLPKIGNVKDQLTIIERIRSFIDFASLVGDDYFTISDKITGIKDGTDFKYTADQNEDVEAVKIMTIHKSKGLEFTYCYFPYLNKRFNFDDFTKIKIGYLEESGLYCKRKTDKANVVFEVGYREAKRKQISEKIRLLYVALTRTKEKITIINKVNPDKAPPAEFEFTDSLSSFGDFLNAIPNFKYDIQDVDVNKDYLSHSYKEYKYKLKKQNYNDVSYLKEEVQEKRASKKVIKVLDEKEKQDIEYGNMLHAIMESVDFHNLESIESKEILNIIQDPKNIFFNDLNNSKFYQELEFIYQMDQEKVHGIIDLLIERDDIIYIVDYKASDIDNKDYDKQLKVYYDYVRSRSSKNVECYLLSLIQNRFRKVEVN